MYAHDNLYLMLDISAQLRSVTVAGALAPRLYTFFMLNSTQLSTKFQLLIKTKIKKFLAVSLLDVVFIMLINVKMPTIVGI